MGVPLVLPPGVGVGVPLVLLPGVGVGVPLPLLLPPSVGVGDGERERVAGSAGQSAGVSNCENSHPPGRHLAPMAGPEICPETHRCRFVGPVHHPQEVGSMPGSARPEVRHWEQVERGGHLSSGPPAQ